MKILDAKQIKRKIKRLAIQILENNFGEKQIALVGINNNGMVFAKLIRKELISLSDIDILLTRVRLNPAKPVQDDITIETPLEDLAGKVVIIADDVANTGRTVFFALKPLMNILPKRIEVAVLVDRKHKSFPVKVDYVGLSLSTTMKEHIEVNIDDSEEWSVYLD